MQVFAKALQSSTEEEIEADIHDGAYKSKQASLFEQQLDLAVELGLNVVIHQRDAWDDTLEMMRPYTGKLRGVFHCFGGTREQAEEVIALDHLVSLPASSHSKTAQACVKLRHKFRSGNLWCSGLPRAVPRARRRGQLRARSIGEQRHGRRLRRQGQRRDACRQAPALRASPDPHRAQLGARPPNRERVGGGRPGRSDDERFGAAITHTVRDIRGQVTAASCRHASTTHRWSAQTTVSRLGVSPTARRISCGVDGDGELAGRGVHDPHRCGGERRVSAKGRAVQLHRLVRRWARKRSRRCASQV